MRGRVRVTWSVSGSSSSGGASASPAPLTTLPAWLGLGLGWELELGRGRGWELGLGLGRGRGRGPGLSLGLRRGEGWRGGGTKHRAAAVGTWARGVHTCSTYTNNRLYCLVQTTARSFGPTVPQSALVCYQMVGLGPGLGNRARVRECTRRSYGTKRTTRTTAILHFPWRYS